MHSERWMVMICCAALGFGCGDESDGGGSSGAGGTASGGAAGHSGSAGVGGATGGVGGMSGSVGIGGVGGMSGSAGVGGATGGVGGMSGSVGIGGVGGMSGSAGVGGAGGGGAGQCQAQLEWSVRSSGDWGGVSWFASTPDDQTWGIVLNVNSPAPSQADWGLGPLDYSKGDIILVKLSATGTVLLAKNGYTAGTDDTLIFDVATGPSGEFFYSGRGVLKLGPNGEQTTDRFVAKVNPDGSNAWFQTFSSDCLITAAGAGVVAVTTGSRKLTMLNGAGQTAWDVGFGQGGQLLLGGVGTLPSGHVLFWGEFNGSPQFGTQTLTTTTKAGFVVEYDASGAFVSARKVDQSLLFADASPTGIYFGNSDGGQLTLGRVAFDGTLVWSRQIPVTGADPNRYVSLGEVFADSNEGFAIHGFAQGEIDLGCGQNPRPTEDSRMLAAFNGDGSARWSEFLSEGPDGVGPIEHLAFDTSGHLIFGAPAYGTVVLAGQTIPSDGRAVFAKYSR